MTHGQDIIELFSQKLDTDAGKEKIAALAGDWIRDRLREESFARKILPPQPVGRSECQISTQHDTMVKLVHVEPKSRAMVMTFRGQPQARLIRAPRCEIPFFTISSEKFEKFEQELLVYGDMPITKIIEENSSKDIQEIEDREFLRHCESAVQALQAEANGVSTAPQLNATSLQGGSPPVEFSVRKGELARVATTETYVPFAMQRPDLVNLYKLMDGRYLRMEMVLLTELDYDDVLQWTVEDFGDKLQSETAVEGYKYNTLLGRPYTRTIKTDILRAGNVYGFAKPEFLGRFYVLNKTKFYIDKIANLITWQCWEDIAMGLVNIAGIRTVELYSCDASVVDADSLKSYCVPKEEEELGAVNNKVDKGLHYPAINTW